MDRTTYKAVMAIVWRLQDEHGFSYLEALRAVDGDPTETLTELELLGLPLTRHELRTFLHAEERELGRRRSRAEGAP